MVQQKLQIVYSTFKELVPRVPTYYIPQGNGGYILCAVAEEFYAHCKIFSGSADITNYEANYKSSGSLAASLDDALILGTIANKIPLKRHYQTDSAMPVTIVGREGSETIWATHNFCDRTTWYGDSQRVESEILSNSGDNLTFSGSNQYWIDMFHGKIFDEKAIRSDYGHGFNIVVVVNGVTQSMREPFATASGDYTVNYKSGSITFASPITSSVTCSYSYENGSSWYLSPTTGKALDFEQAEIQFSQDVIQNDRVDFVVQGPAQVFAPDLVAANILPADYMLDLETTSYDTIHQMIDEALGSYPTIPAIGGPIRGFSSPIYGFPFTYNAVRRLKNSLGLRLKVCLKDNMAFGGERATATFYCVARPETDLS
jgi:hypothetical protein